MNLRWSWDERTRDLFRWVDPDGWDASVHDPVRLLGLVRRDPARRPGRRQRVPALPVRDRRRAGAVPHPAAAGSRAGRRSARCARSAYFSPEFGIAEALPQYSGGLGVLAGDHLKAASDLGVPLVGVGLFYRNGYFRQRLSLDGWQQEQFPTLDPYAMALTLCDGVRVRSTWPASRSRRRSGGPTSAAPRCTCSTPTSRRTRPELRAVTDRLYGGDAEHRIRQEILLGIGGVRALRALGIDAQVFHTNEGHAGFLGLERMRELVAEGLGLAPRRSKRCGRAACSPPTRRCRPASTASPRALMDRYFKRFVEQYGATVEQLMRARPPRRRARGDPLQHGGDGPAPGRAVQRRRPAPRRREPRDVPPASGPTCPWRRCRSPA